MEIVNVQTLDKMQQIQAAQMLTDELPLGWPTLADAKAEINERWSNEPDALFLAAVDDGTVIGWCGILPHYDDKVFEIHPMVVRHDRQRKGIGTALINEIENAARVRGGLIIWAGADDDKPDGETSFANVDLFDDLPKRIREFSPGTHQSAFYLKQGYKIIGVMPDANGPGKPDIFLAKRL